MECIWAFNKSYEFYLPNLYLFNNLKHTKQVFKLRQFSIYGFPRASAYFIKKSGFTCLARSNDN